MFWTCGRVSEQPGGRRTPKLSVCPSMYICFGVGLDGIFTFGPFEVSKDHKIGRHPVNLGLPSQLLTQEYKMTFKTPIITVTKSYPTLTGTSQSLSTATQPYEKRFELPEKMFTKSCFTCTISIISLVSPLHLSYGCALFDEALDNVPTSSEVRAFQFMYQMCIV